MIKMLAIILRQTGSKKLSFCDIYIVFIKTSSLLGPKLNDFDRAQDYQPREGWRLMLLLWYVSDI